MKKRNETALVFCTAGDRGLLVEFGRKVDPETNAVVRAMVRTLQQTETKGIVEIIPSYHSLLIIYDPVFIQPCELKSTVVELEARLDKTAVEPGRVVEIPVCYGGEFGPDIQDIGGSYALCLSDIVRLHSEPEYLIYMVGFTPGFPFLGGLHKKLFTPRLKTPRLVVPQGSVGIANDQTGMYPVASPGGWRIIGRTPLKLFAPRRKNPFLYRAGDKIRFVPISKEEFADRKEKEDAQWEQ